jgi:hypothetical protein
MDPFRVFAGIRPWQIWLVSLGSAALALIGAAAAIEGLGDPDDAGPTALVPFEWTAADAAGVPLRASLSEVAVDGDDVLLDPAGLSLDGVQPLPEPGPGLAGPAPPLPPAPPPPPRPVAAALPKAPIGGLTAPGPRGFLPKIRSDGLTPLDAYRRPFSAGSEKGRVSIIISGLGFSAETTRRAIETLPAEVTLAFVPYASNLQSWIDAARARGHEVLLELPMEPFDAASVDTGPQTLLAGGAGAENLRRMDDLLSRAVGYCGVLNYQGGRFANAADAAGQFHEVLQQRGLAFLASGVPIKSPLLEEGRKRKIAAAAAERVLDARRDADAIAAQLEGLEKHALSRGDALGSGFSYPVTIDQVAHWSETARAKGLALTPACSLAKARAGR